MEPGTILHVVDSAGLEFSGGESLADKRRLRCPFPAEHKNGDKHPSAYVSVSGNFFSCSVCGTLNCCEFAVALRRICIAR